MRLQGFAKTWYRRGDLLHANSDFSSFKSQFLEVFPLNLNKKQLAAQIYSRQYQPSENCVVFALETIKLCYFWKPEAAESEVLATLIGQMDHYFQDYLELRTPTIVQQCFMFLRTYDERHGDSVSHLQLFQLASNIPATSSPREVEGG